MNTSLNTYLESNPSILSNPKQLWNQGITVLLKCMFSNHSIIHFFHCTFNQIEFLQMEIFIQPSNLSGKYNTIHASMIPLEVIANVFNKFSLLFMIVCSWWKMCQIKGIKSIWSSNIFNKAIFDKSNIGKNGIGSIFLFRSTINFL